jgi:predicted nucleic acid-binding protein
MTTERFSLDSNVLVYAADGRAGLRHTRALQIVIRAARRDCVLTLQVLGEFFHAATRKRIVPRHEAVAQIRDLLSIFATVTADADAFRMALEGAAQGRHSFWDGLLVATAARAGCAFVLSEDMQRSSGKTCRNESQHCCDDRAAHGQRPMRRSAASRIIFSMLE